MDEVKQEIKRHIMRGIEEYVQRYKSSDKNNRERISKEVGLYLSNVTEREDDYLFYASKFVCRCHQHTLLERLKDWSKK